MLSRRKLLQYGVILGGSLTPSLALGFGAAADKSVSDIANLDMQFWPYHRTDPLVAEQLAYEQCFKGHCCYGAFSGIFIQLANSYGEPYRRFPIRMMEYGFGGIGGSRTLCGALNGGAAAIGLFHDGAVRGELIKQLFQWYESAELPGYQPSQPKLVKGELPRTTAQSVLCSASVNAWCEKSGFKWDSNERRERCARLTADVSRKTAELLNGRLES
ncbi:MAG: C-GCAxxG-C-C family protein [Acidobacteriota bacterium]|nr:C-GCAxxG-C-C family protein [Acidobacteriota bacterium]